MGRALQLKVMVLGGYRTWHRMAMESYGHGHGPSHDLWQHGHEEFRQELLVDHHVMFSQICKKDWCGKEKSSILNCIWSSWSAFKAKNVLPWSWTSCQTSLASVAHSPGEKPKSFEEKTNAKKTSCKAAKLAKLEDLSYVPPLRNAFRHGSDMPSTCRISRSNLWIKKGSRSSEIVFYMFYQTI